jgi:metal-responsive CopG/Arc/MetJ family transcriptional regulator
MKTAISLPDSVFKHADRFAKNKRISRSALFVTAVDEYLLRHDGDDVTRKLNEVYAGETSRLDPVVAGIQAVSLRREEW